MKNLILFLLLFSLFLSCKKRENSIRWNIDGIAPIAYGELSIYDILPDSILATNPDSSVNIKLDLNLYTLDLDSLVALPDTFLIDTFALPFLVPITAVPGQTFINQPEGNVLSLGSAELTFIKIKSGAINYQLKSTIKGKVIYEYQIPVATDMNGNSFSQLVYVPAATAGTSAYANGSFDLSGYSIDLSGVSGNSFNIIQTNVNVKVDPNNGSNITASNQDTVFISNQLSGITIDKAVGYFGNESFEVGPYKEKITAFDNLITGNIDINQINVDLELINGIGADATITFNSITVSKDAIEIALNHAIIGSNLNINRANKVGQTISPYIYSVALNNANSNIDNMLELLPDSIGYGLSLQLNPLGNVSAHNDFISSDSPMELNMAINLPLSIFANDLTLADTIVMPISDTSGVISVKLTINIENGFPLDAQLDLALLDQNNMIIGHIFSPTTIPSASINSNGIVINSNNSIHILTLNEKDLNTFVKNEKLLLKIIFNTPPSGSHINIYDYNKIKFNIVAAFEYGVEIKTN